MKVNGTRVEDLAGTGLVTRQRYVVPIWVSILGVIGAVVTRTVIAVVVIAYRHPWVSMPTLLLSVMYWRTGWPGVAALVTAAALLALVWARLAPASFDRELVQRGRGWWRWQTRYRRSWHPAMDGTGLTRTTPSRHVYVPLVARVRSTRTVDVLSVRLLHGQTPAELALQAEGLRHVFAAHRCTVTLLRPGWVRVTFYARDPLTRTIDAIPPAADVAGVDLRGLHVGTAEDGTRYLLRVAGRHLLIAGATGAGKGSALWSPIRALCPAVHAGLVELHGIDPKRMELVFAPHLFTRLEATDLAAMVELLEEQVQGMKARQEVMAGIARDHVPSLASPAVVTVIDELASLTAYNTDRDLKKRAEAALSLLLSQGRAVGYYVIAALQDPRKEIVAFRDLFPTRIALRTTEDSHVDMILGQGALDAGAACHLIPDSMPGVGYVRVEGVHEPVRVRFAYVTDDDLRDMRTRWHAPGHAPAPELFQPAAENAENAEPSQDSTTGKTVTGTIIDVRDLPQQQDKHDHNAQDAKDAQDRDTLGGQS